MFGVWLYCASTPTAALRTHLFLLGYPTSAFGSDFIQHDDSLYKLTKPPVERATQGTLTTFIVHQYGPIYIAQYYGET
ncbi:MAG: hypothetical protein ABS948_08470 [Solibacillus sp.]